MVETKTDGSKVETNTETKTDGTKTEKVVETKTDGSKVEKNTETKTDGSKTEKVVETKTDGSVKTTETVTSADGSAEKKEAETVKNTAGAQVAVTTTTKTDANGSVTDITQQAVIENVDKDTSATVTVKKDSSGNTTAADAEVTKTVEGNKVSLTGGVIAQLKEAAGGDDVAVTLTVKDNSGNTKYKLQADANDLEPGNQLFIYQYNSATGEYVMVNAKKYNVDANGSVDVSMSKNATYQLMSAADAEKVSKEILKTVSVKKSSATVKPGKSTKLALSDKVNKENIKSIKYSTTKNSVAKVSKSGKVTAKKAGKVTVKATVTLKNGKKKTVKMKIRVK